MKQQWLEINGGLYMFGEGGITRVEEFTHYDTSGKQSTMCRLYANEKSVTTVVATEAEIKKVLGVVEKVGAK